MRLASMSLIAAMMILGGCASSATTPQRGGTARTPNEHQVDHAKMASVERVALSRGVRVFWVNPPEK